LVREGLVANIRAIAKKAGVSISTVSRVLNNVAGVSAAAREAVLLAVTEAGYLPETGRKSTSNIALVYTAAPTLESPFDAALLIGVYAGLEGSDADLLILDANRSRQPGETITQMLIRKGVRGALLRTTADSKETCEEILTEGCPAVVVGSRVDTPGALYAYSDSRPASREAVEHLIGLGHSRIAMAIHIVDDSDHADRVAGYREALEAHGIDFDERLLLRVPATRDGGAQVVRRLASWKDRPTAIYLADPFAAVGVLVEARRTGLRVPEDLSLVGFDDGELRHTLIPQLTAVCQDTVALGRTAVSLLLRLVAGGPNRRPSSEVLRCWLEIHETTDPLLEQRSKRTR
jgi:DNA-binding LacI/PurR family transcriptional regulator